jgi:hypothetical protein
VITYQEGKDWARLGVKQEQCFIHMKCEKYVFKQASNEGICVHEQKGSVDSEDITWAVRPLELAKEGPGKETEVDRQTPVEVPGNSWK